MSVALFKDLDKTARDLVGRGYTFDRKLTTKVSTGSGVTFSTEFVSSSKGVKAKAGAKFAAGSYVRVDKLEINNKSRVKGEATLVKLVPNTTFSLATELGPINSKGTDSGSVGVEYRTAALSATVDFDVVSTSVAATSTFKHGAFLLGAGGKFDVPSGDEGKGGLSAADVAAGYDGGNFSVVARSAAMFSKGSLAVHHKCAADTTWAATASFTPGSDSSSAAAVAFDLGVDHKLDSSSSVKAKVNSAGIVSASYSQALRKGVTLGVSASIDATKMDTDANHKWGFELACKA